ncbi:hypothetical protein HA402_000577 [Bradysia odoriphaga]|nr:hypothetical protein HA402_000577 [Bradysia odoriphaga]
MEIDVNRSCRSCLSESDAIHPIGKAAKSFGPVAKDSYMWNMSLAEVIMACTVVNISPDDGLPQSVCTQCLHQVQQAFQFKEKCEAADAKLRHHSINKSDDPISFMPIKTESFDMERMFHPETVLVTEFQMDESDDESQTSTTNIDDDRLVIKRETNKKQQGNDSAGTKSKKRHSNVTTVTRSAAKVKIEQLLDDVDEKTLLEEAEIRADGRYQCKFCAKTLADRQTFRLHIRLHTGTNLKRCSICDRGFAKKNHLERHLATHDKTHKCTFCTRAYLTANECQGSRKIVWQNQADRIKPSEERRHITRRISGYRGT